MRWRNKTYAFASRLQMAANHADYALEAPVGFGHHHLIVADLVILAKHTTQIAASKKNCPRPSAPRDGRFLAVMQANVGNKGLASDPAKSGFSCQSINPALTWAASAVA